MKNYKSITFDKAAQDNLPQHIKDKNGKDIYEGDVITFDGITSGGKIIIAEVKFSSERLRYEYGSTGVWNPFSMMTMPIPIVIGNIHDNPELL
jgi:hypothetical protein